MRFTSSLIVAETFDGCPLASIISKLLQFVESLALGRSVKTTNRFVVVSP
jgi:hypothetical protein